MKKFVYSAYTKFVALCLMLVCAFQTVSLVTNCMIEYFGSDNEIYAFEDKFENSSRISSKLCSPVFNVLYACEEYKEAQAENEITEKDLQGTPMVKFQVFPNNGQLVKTIDSNGFGQIIQLIDANSGLVSLIKEKMSYVDENILDYIISVDGTVIKSDESLTVEKILSERFFINYYNDKNEGFGYSSTANISHLPFEYLYDSFEGFEIEIYASLNNDYAEQTEKIWTEQRNLVLTTFSQCTALVFVFVLLLIYLICTCGKRADGELCEMWLDKIPVEIHLGFMALFFGLALGIAFTVFDEFFSSGFPEYLIKTIVTSSSTIAILIIITSLLSLIRKVKCGTFLKTSIVFVLLKLCYVVLKKSLKLLVRIMKTAFSILVKGIKGLYRALFIKTSLILVTLMTAYSALLIFLFIVCIDNELGFVLLLMLFAVGIVFVAYRAKDFENISKGAMEIRNGNLSYVIDTPKSDDMKKLAVNINEIAKGLDESVSAKMRAERLKTELITNVSHDLKTPLTSIINYAQLLSELCDLPEQAKDYVSIISRKSDRLKTLTQDLFDISKVQSGNESIEREKLDISLLINQSLGENDGEIKNSGISFVTDTEKEIYIFADGRKMSRVITNLISNILKYSMKGTRAFITSKIVDGKAQIEFKNISSYIMDFDTDEITARFVRGDKSRSEEGSGLGLAIAKGYAEACGGSFDVIIDGDMFKVVMKFDLYE